MPHPHYRFRTSASVRYSLLKGCLVDKDVAEWQTLPHIPLLAWWEWVRLKEVSGADVDAPTFRHT